MKRMIKRTVAAGAMTLAVSFGAAGAAGAGVTPTTAPGAVEVEPGVYVIPTSLVRETTTTAPPTQVAGVQLARTGNDADRMVLLGGGLAAAGAVFVLGTRRRRKTAS